MWLFCYLCRHCTVVSRDTKINTGQGFYYTSPKWYSICKVTYCVCKLMTFFIVQPFSVLIDNSMIRPNVAKPSLYGKDSLVPLIM